MRLDLVGVLRRNVMQFKLLYLLCSQINSINSRKKLLHNKTCTYYVVGVLFLGKNRILENNIQTTRIIINTQNLVTLVK